MSMPNVRVTCHACGDIEMQPGGLALDVGDGASPATYSFRCPICATTQRRAASERVVSVLMAIGVRTGDSIAAAAITEEEISAFRRALDGDWHRHLTIS